MPLNPEQGEARLRVPTMLLVDRLVNAPLVFPSRESVVLCVVYQFNEENAHTSVRNLKLNCFGAENCQNNYKHGDVER